MGIFYCSHLVGGGQLFLFFVFLTVSNLGNVFSSTTVITSEQLTGPAVHCRNETSAECQFTSWPCILSILYVAAMFLNVDFIFIYLLSKDSNAKLRRTVLTPG